MRSFYASLSVGPFQSPVLPPPWLPQAGNASPRVLSPWQYESQGNSSWGITNMTEDWIVEDMEETFKDGNTKGLSCLWDKKLRS